MAVSVKWSWRFSFLTLFLVTSSCRGMPQDSANDLITSAKKGLPELRKSLADFVPSTHELEDAFNASGVHLQSAVDAFNASGVHLPFAVNSSQLPSIEQGDKMIEEKCLKNGGNGSYAEAMVAKDELQFCMKDMLDYKKINAEIETAKPTGDLDKVFRKYCRSTPKLKGCINNFTTSIEPCLEESEKVSKQIIMNITTALEQFICYKEGDRIALFIGEGGKECISDKWEAIQHCGNVTFSKYMPADMNELPDVTESLPVFKLEKDECLKINEFQQCVVAELTKCKEPTPANIVDSLMNFVRLRTPCRDYKPASQTGAASSVQSPTSAIILMLLVTAASTVRFS